MAEYIVLRNLAVDSKRAPGQAESKNWDWSAGPFEAATKSMRELEAVVRECPGQYLWAHRRFKTRPPGEPPVY